MRQRVGWALVIGGVVVVLGLLTRFGVQQPVLAAPEAPKGQATKPEVAPTAPQAATGPSKEEKIVYTFPDQAKMEEFTKVWQQRQGIILRMTVLQAYWNEEQAALAQLNNKFSTDYKLDVTKNYTLDDKRRVLIEREAPPTPPAPTSQTIQQPSARSSTP